jgi:hypothetical protein
MKLGDFQQRTPRYIWLVAPKGRIMSAQGIALGWIQPYIVSPEGAT